MMIYRLSMLLIIKNNSGFSIISGDSRTNAILEFSTEGNFNFDKKEMPEGLVDWLNNTDSQINEIRTNRRVNQFEDDKTSEPIEFCEDKLT